MRVEVNRAKCEGYGLCEQVAPALYELDEEGELILKVDDPVPADLQEAAQAGARSCPVAALQVRR